MHDINQTSPELATLTIALIAVGALAVAAFMWWLIGAIDRRLGGK